jgi:hypothetical protein
MHSIASAPRRNRDSELASAFAENEKLLRCFCKVFLGTPILPLSSILPGNVTVCPEICRRFGGGSDRNRALLRNEGNSVHDMQIVQSRINTAYFASC